ncbi:MAG: hypothetical protein EOO93_16310 [Pedobacter sp.]|nr:MAG: hypothetical protein EOO93_16310 [Pedobacter sp.]
MVKGNLVKNYNQPSLVYTNIRSEDLTERLNNNYINYTTHSADSNLKTISSEIEVKSFPVYLFFRPNKNLYFRSYGYIKDKPTYMKMLDEVDQAYKKESIADLEQVYLSDQTNNNLIRKLIDQRKSLGYTNNSKYIDSYATNLNVRDFNDYQTVLYILEASPYSNGKAIKLAYLNKAIIDSIFKYEPISKRLDLNGRIIRNTMNEAIRTKDLGMAQSAANFSRYSWNKDYEKASRAYATEMLRFYSETKDTSNYFKLATPYYDRQYMIIKPDSLKKLIAYSSSNSSNINKDSISNILKNHSLSYSNDLAFVAMKFDHSGTKNTSYINKAIAWCNRAIEVNAFGSYYNTLAQLQYKIGSYTDAIKNEQIAIRLIKKDRLNTRYFESQLKKMIDRTL